MRNFATGKQKIQRVKYSTCLFFVVAGTGRIKCSENSTGYSERTVCGGCIQFPCNLLTQRLSLNGLINSK